MLTCTWVHIFAHAAVMQREGSKAESDYTASQCELLVRLTGGPVGYLQ